MRTIRWTSAFKSDFKRVSRGGRYPAFEPLLSDILSYLQRDTSLPERYLDHSLQGSWKNHRDCHLYPDLLLIYYPESLASVALIRLGTHSEIFG